MQLSGDQASDSGNASERWLDESPVALAHDFRNAVQCAASALQACERRARAAGDADLVQLLADGTSAFQRALALAEKLTSSRAASGARQLVWLQHHLPGMQRILSHAAGPELSVDVLVSSDLPPVLCDPGALEHALINLAVNAKEAVAGGGRVVVEAHNCSERHDRPQPMPNRCLCLSVTDTGRGMTDEVAANAFVPFFSTKSETYATGLGLARVRNFAVSLGGSVELRSRPGVGTSIRIHLPVSENGADQRFAPETSGLSRDFDQA